MSAMKWSRLVLMGLGLSGAGSAWADGLVRVYCDEDSAGAALAINGVQKGSCPADLFLPTGKHNVVASKAVDAEHERRFEQSILVRDDVPLRLFIELSAPQLTKAAARKREELVQREAALQRQKAVQEDLAGAETGSAAAIASLVRRYTEGDGVARDASKAKAWQGRLLKAQKAEAEQTQQRATAGDPAAMRELALLLREGRGVERSPEQAAAWEQQASQLDAKAKAQAQSAAAVSNFTFFSTFQSFMESDISTSFGKEMESENFLGVTTSIYPWAASATVAALTDMASLPFNITSYQQLKASAEGHAAAWHEPDSLMARAYARRQGAVSNATPL